MSGNLLVNSTSTAHTEGMSDQQNNNASIGQDDKLRQYTILYPISSAHKQAMESTRTQFMSIERLSNRQKEKAAYDCLAEFLFDYEIRSGTLLPGDQNIIESLVVSMAAQTVRYPDPRTGNNREIDLLTIEDEAVSAAVRSFYEDLRAEDYQRRHSVVAYSKGNWQSGPSLIRNTPSLKALPNDFSYLLQRILPLALLKFQPSERNAIVRRMLFCAFFHFQFTSKIQFRTEQAKQVLAQAKNDQEKLNASNNLELLRRLLKKLNELDMYALFKALSALPLGHVWFEDKKDIARKLIKEIETDIVTRSQSLFSFIFEFWKIRDPDKDERAYAFDVARTLFIKRGEYFQFCNDEDKRVQMEVIEDVFMREAVSFADETDTFTAEGFKKSFLFHYFPAELKKGIIEDLTALATLAVNAIPYAPENEYDAAEKTEGAMRRAIDAHAKRVKWDLSPNQN